MVSDNRSYSAARLKRLRAEMDKRGIAAYLMRNTSDIAWATAFDAVFDEEQAHALLVDAEHAWLHTDSRYALACRQAAGDGPIQVEDERVSHAVWAARHLAREPYAAPTGSSWLAVEDALTVREYRALKDACEQAGLGEPFRFLSEFGTSLRAVKDDFEVARCRSAQEITDAAFAYIVSFMKAGMTERQVQLALDAKMRELGSDGLSFPTIVATGAHAASAHAQPGDTVIAEGDAIVMDFGAKKDGYCSDMTRTVFAGQPDEQVRRAYACLRRINEEVEAWLAPGRSAKEAHEMAERMLAEDGFGGAMGHSLGHGVGIDIHELPVLSPRTDAVLEPGNIVTVEPGIYLPGRFGMRLEDFGVISACGFSVLTQSPHDMVII
ncbi:MAG: M24 family metallopeptidase [Eggerthellaceae bacterium]